MTDETTVHIDVYLSVNHEKPQLVGHDNIAKGSDAEVAGRVASVLHTIAWGFEDRSESMASREDSVADDFHAPNPRVVTNSQGDKFFEGAPDEFTIGMSYSDAVESYGRSGYSDSFDSVLNAYPGSTWEYLEGES